MDRKELEAKVIELVAMAYGKNAEDLSVDSTFKEDLAGASIQMVGLVSELENELDVMVALQDASACVTIGDLVDKVEEEM
ncbi:MAG: acyl carrier protein [Lachnospiraceae bacterium]|jgi:acyl carrier protein|nr:acyl carrier protein [Lachnospiraceae bacterium]